MSWLKPTYGEKVHVTPKRWWSRKDRKLARLNAAILDYRADDLYAEVRTRLLDELTTGASFVDVGGRRIDPSRINPDF